MKRYALILLILLTVMFLPTKGKETQKTIPELPKLSTSVELLIQGDKTLEYAIRNYISTELQSLGDVKVVRDKPEWYLDIQANKIFTPCNQKPPARPVGFILSIAILRPARIDRETLQIVLDGKISEKDCKALRGYIGQTYWYVSHMAWIGTDLQSLCQEAIKYFDTKHLRPDIESIREEHEAARQKRDEEKDKVRALREKIRKERGNPK